MKRTIYSSIITCALMMASVTNAYALVGPNFPQIAKYRCAALYQELLDLQAEYNQCLAANSGDRDQCWYLEDEARPLLLDYLRYCYPKPAPQF
ncbi:MAG: hypothetical protein ACN2B6_06675 [Rickettsiales bacterium]